MHRKSNTGKLHGLHVPVIQSVLAPAILEAAEAESLFGEHRRPGLKLL